MPLWEYLSTGDFHSPPKNLVWPWTPGGLGFYSNQIPNLVRPCAEHWQYVAPNNHIWKMENLKGNVIVLREQWGTRRLHMKSHQSTSYWLVLEAITTHAPKGQSSSSTMLFYRKALYNFFMTFDLNIPYLWCLQQSGLVVPVSTRKSNPTIWFLKPLVANMSQCFLWSPLFEAGNSLGMLPFQIGPEFF